MPAIPVGPTQVETKQATIATSETPFGAPLMHRSRCTYRLELTSDDAAETDEAESVVDLIITGPQSKVLEIQRFVRALTLNDKTRHHEAPGR